MSDDRVWQVAEPEMNRQEPKAGPKPPYVLTSMDLEFNQAPTGAKIIQIGAVVGNLITGEILEKLSVFINPNEELLPFITQLTKITQSDVNSGMSLEKGYRLLEALHRRHGSFVNFVQWGQGDSRALLEQLQKENPQFTGWCGGRRELDAKTLYVAWRLAQCSFPTGGLAKAMTKLGLKFVGQKHSAVDDALNTFTIFRHLVGKLRNGTQT